MRTDLTAEERIFVQMLKLGKFTLARLGRDMKWHEAEVRAKMSKLIGLSYNIKMTRHDGQTFYFIEGKAIEVVV